MAKLVWEIMTEYTGSLQRIAVPGGWLVRTSDESGTSICFYPDPEHLWEPTKYNG